MKVGPLLLSFSLLKPFHALAAIAYAWTVSVQHVAASSNWLDPDCARIQAAFRATRNPGSRLSSLPRTRSTVEKDIQHPNQSTAGFGVDVQASKKCTSRGSCGRVGMAV